jgi:predicted metal-dependent phosphoesterase TrpH
MNEETLQSAFSSYITDLKSLESINNFYDYEKKFSEIHRDFGKKVLEKSLEKLSETGRKKNFTRSMEK